MTDQEGIPAKELTMKIIRVELEFLEFPPTHTCDGQDLSPAIHISDAEGISLAVMAVNPYQPSCCSFSPWIAWNIPPVGLIPAGIPNIPVVTAPISCLQGINDAGQIGYTGPCPPPGMTHRYTFKVWGLDSLLDLAPGSLKHQLVEAMRGHVLWYGETVAMCRR